VVTRHLIIFIQILFPLFNSSGQALSSLWNKLGLVCSVKCNEHYILFCETQGVYKFNWTNFQEIPGGISRKIQDVFALLRPAMQCTESIVCLNIEQKHDMYNMGAVANIKRATSFLNKRSGTQFHHDWKPMQSIIDILHKNFQEDNTNSRRFPGDTLRLTMIDLCLFHYFHLLIWKLTLFWHSYSNLSTFYFDWRFWLDRSVHSAWI